MADYDPREAMERLNQSNRVLQEARMLPANKPLTVQQTYEVIERFQKYIADRGVKLAKVAREVSYSPSVISQWAANTYKGDMDAVTRAVNGWLERDARRERAEQPRDYVKTWVAEMMRSIAYQADKRVMMAAIVAPAGSGKSKVLRALTDEMRGLFLYAEEDVSARAFLASLALQLGRSNALGIKADLLRFVIESLKGTKRIIFLDEAHQLRKCISTIRSIHDQAQVPIVLAGTSDVLKYVDDRRDGRGQFSSRCIRFNVIDDICDDERPGGNAAGRDLFTLEEIRQFFSMKGMRLADDAMMLAWALACLPNHGTLRLVERLAENAIDLNPGVTVIERDHLLEALTMFCGRREATYIGDLAGRREEPAAKVRVA